MDGQEYYKDGAARVLDLMRDTFGDYFREYFNGEPENITTEQLPCLMVTTPRLNVTNSANGLDDLREVVTIVLALNKRDDIGADSTDNLTMRRLRNLIIGLDPATPADTIPQYLPNTVMYAVRKHITLNGLASNNDIEIDFDVNIRGEDTATQEAYITLSIDRQALVGGRD